MVGSSSASMILPVIMSGGSGTRLWPLSTAERPKQFHPLCSELSLLQETGQRVHDPAAGFLPPLVICNRWHAEAVQTEFSAVGLALSGIVLEPFARNTASVAVIAAQWALDHVPGALVLLLPADHLIADPAGFRLTVLNARSAARDHIVTFGITPTRPETGYGYVQGAEALYNGVFSVRRFVEKPSLAVAERYLSEGGYSWNAGIFLFAPEALLGEASRFAPAIHSAALESLAKAEHQNGFIALDTTAFEGCPSASIDSAILEHTEIAAVSPCEVGWADVGSWAELWSQGPRDGEANMTHGDVLAIETSGSLVWTDGPDVSLLGVSDLVVVVAGGRVLVVPRSRAQDVKMLAEARR